VTRGGEVRQWVREFKDGRRNAHDEDRSCRASGVNDGLVEKVQQENS
jgi:hypothetical protein